MVTALEDTTMIYCKYIQSFTRTRCNTFRPQFKHILAENGWSDELYHECKRFGGTTVDHQAPSLSRALPREDAVLGVSGIGNALVEELGTLNCFSTYSTSAVSNATELSFHKIASDPDMMAQLLTSTTGIRVHMRHQNLG